MCLQVFDRPALFLLLHLVPAASRYGVQRPCTIPLKNNGVPIRQRNVQPVPILIKPSLVGELPSLPQNPFSYVSRIVLPLNFDRLPDVRYHKVCGGNQECPGSHIYRLPKCLSESAFYQVFLNRLPDVNLPSCKQIPAQVNHRPEACTEKRTYQLLRRFGICMEKRLPPCRKIGSESSLYHSGQSIDSEILPIYFTCGYIIAYRAKNHGPTDLGKEVCRP